MPRAIAEIESPAVFGQLGRSEVHRDPAIRVLEGGVLDRHADAITRFTDGRFRQSDDGGGRQAAGKMDLDDHLGRRDTFLRARKGNGEAHDGRYRNR